MFMDEHQSFACSLSALSEMRGSSFKAEKRANTTSRVYKHFAAPRLFFLVVVVLVIVNAASAATLTVGQAGSFSSIQAAINAAAAGDIVQVQAGTYTGNLIVNKQIVLEGINRPVLRGEGTGSVITVLADRCTVKGFIIEHSGGDLTREHFSAGLVEKWMVGGIGVAGETCEQICHFAV